MEEIDGPDITGHVFKVHLPATILCVISSACYDGSRVLFLVVVTELENEVLRGEEESRQMYSDVYYNLSTLRRLDAAANLTGFVLFVYLLG